MNTAHAEDCREPPERDAYLYVRQSSRRQVFDHGESTRRQYALRERRPWRWAGRPRVLS